MDKIYMLTEIGLAEASTPSSEPSPEKRVCYYLRRRTNNAASYEMIKDMVFDGDSGACASALSKLARNQAIRAIA